MIRFDYKQKLFIQVLFEQLKDAGLEVNLDIQPNGACIHLIDKALLYQTVVNSAYNPQKSLKLG